jgi:hypothetical protein
MTGARVTASGGNRRPAEGKESIEQGEGTLTLDVKLAMPFWWSRKYSSSLRLFHFYDFRWRMALSPPEADIPSTANTHVSARPDCITVMSRG